MHKTPESNEGRESLKLKVYRIIGKAKSSEDTWSLTFDIFIITIILINVLAVILETVESLFESYRTLFNTIEVISIGVFLVEYILRIWVSNCHPGRAHPLKGRFAYIFSFYGFVDLVSILPFFLPTFFSFDGRFLRVLRVFKVVRAFKIGRYSKSFALLLSVVERKRYELFSCLFILFILLLVASTAMYYSEHHVQPDQFSSIPKTMWWAVATLTTVGYGDVYPITSLGRVVGSLIAIMGIGIFALPAGIIASGIGEELDRVKEAKREEIEKQGRRKKSE